MSKKRQWKEDYVVYGFTYTTEKYGTQRPQCILCSKIFSNSNLKTSKLLEYFNNMYGGKGTGHSLNISKSKKALFDASGTITKLGGATIQKPLLKVSYQVGLEHVFRFKGVRLTEKVKNH
ncbi:protein FAM200C-like [Arctopsyche grandis]|uniref:protein FAM200C-like n=1 Tax=Arctopsyche grandis TaxID=121162 RepID=UPI00406D72B5